MGLTLTPGIRNLLSQWGAITKAAATRLGVAGTWYAIADALNVPEGTTVKGFATIQEMNTVYGLAVANRNAAELFAGADEDQAVTAAMIGVTPNARNADVQAAAPLYNVRVQYSYTEGGTAKTDWLTVQLPQSLESMTVGSLTDLATTLADLAVTGYGVSTVTYTSFAISAA